MHVIDLRSDTVTQPTDEMREAMASARVGDDMFGDDPTVNALQKRAADLMGFEDALFVPSGVMGNQIALWVHSGRQGQVICDQHSHIALYEGGAGALLSGVHLNTITTRDGILRPESIAPRIYPDDMHFARTKLIEIENTHNWGGGVVWKRKALDELTAFAEQVRIPVHMDGARLMNAAVASKQSPEEITRGMASTMFCLSKGLSAPVGSMLCGSKPFIQEAKRVRKALDGAMRQSGHLAAAGLVALDQGPGFLVKDHANARRLASGLERIPGLRVLPARPRTNIVYFDTAGLGIDAAAFMDVAKKVGVLGLTRDTGTIARFVTNRHIRTADVDEAVTRLREVFADAQNQKARSASQPRTKKRTGHRSS